MSQLRIGAVRYLNMLPYFFDSTDVKVFDSPADLNTAMRNGECDAGCMSAIAGIKAGFSPVEPMMGVASSETVGSVFVEPLLQTSAQKDFWNRFLMLNGSQEEPNSFRLSSPSTVAIFTSGASEQSLWLVRLLLHWQGHKTTVHIIEKDVSKDIDSFTLQNLLLATGASQALFLCIGDVALYRVFENKSIEPFHRWDVALLWKRARGVPCVFATWFMRPDVAPALHKSLAIFLMNSLERWHALGTAQQLSHAEAFLRQKNDPLVESLRTTSASQAMTHYFRSLDFVFSEPYRHTYSQYLTHSDVDF